MLAGTNVIAYMIHNRLVKAWHLICCNTFKAVEVINDRSVMGRKEFTLLISPVIQLGAGEGLVELSIQETVLDALFKGLLPLVITLAMAILVCTGFMNEIPRELDESACIDGCGVFGVFFRIIVPLMRPAVATVGIYTFLQCWNELMFANVFISKNALRTLPVGVQALSGQYTTEWGPIGAALVLATFPTLFVYIFLSKKIQESFIAGAIKG